MLNTPFEASRFVSLIPFERRENPGSQKVELWQTTHTMLASMKGDVEDHAVLLCNLLLGFGLDAYLAIGVTINGPHCWVITRSIDEAKKIKIVYWESLTGNRVMLEDPKIFRYYKRIHSLFNDKSFYANVQADDTVFNTKYTFEDEFLWKSIPRDKLESLVKYNLTPNLEYMTDFKFLSRKEIELEREIKKRLEKLRKAQDLPTQYDNKLSFILAPALANYEFERVANAIYGNDEFKQAIKNNIPEGYTFKGFPVQVIDFDSDKIMAIVLNSEVQI